MLAFLKTNDSLVLKFKGSTKVVPLHSPIVPKLMELIKANATDDELLLCIDPSLKVAMHKSGLFGVENGCVYVLGERMPDSLGNRVLDFANSDLPFQPLLAFWENCKKNPDPRAKTDLYKFLEANGHPITSDGCFVGYRNVRRDVLGKLMDWHTGTIDNSVGQDVTMDRATCDSDPHSACSRGLHVAMLSYASTFHTEENAVIVEVKVNPADVVAIPHDCNGQKMRVCRYLVLAENTDGLINRHVYDEENLPSDLDVSDLDGDEEDDGDDVLASDDNFDDEDETGAVSQSVDFAKPKDDGVRIDTGSNWKSQKRDSNGRFLPRGA